MRVPNSRQKKALLYSASVVLIFAISVWVAPSRSEAVTRLPVASTFFGMDIIGPKVWPSAPIGALGKGVVSGWRHLEPARGVYKWGITDIYVEAAKRHGIDVLYTFDATPQWASARPAERCYAGPIGCAASPSNIRDWEDFVTALVTRYKGRIKIYELWNEPTTQLEWSGTYGEMIKLAKSAYRIIKSIDANAVVLTPAPSANGYQPQRITSPLQPDWMREYLRAGGDSFADGGSWHAYPRPNACNQRIDCAGTPLITQINSMRTVFEHSGLAGKPVYITEGGWGRNSILPDPDEQAAYVARWYILLASQGIVRAYWHAWDDSDWGTLRDPADGLREAGVAYEQIYKWLVGATFTRPCVASGDVWTCGLTRNNSYQATIIWKNSGSQAYSPSGKYRQYRDLTGHSAVVSGSITIGIKPILLETASRPS